MFIHNTTAAVATVYINVAGQLYAVIGNIHIILCNSIFYSCIFQRQILYFLLLCYPTPIIT